MPLGQQQAQSEKSHPQGIKTQLDSIHSRLSLHDEEINNHKDVIKELDDVFKKDLAQRLDDLEDAYKVLSEYVHN